MKYLLLIAALFCSLPAYAQTGFTPVTKEQANTYFANCVAQPQSQFLTKDSQNLFCACTAARMTQFFSVEDMKTMMSPDAAVARPAFNKMLVNVYAPCMETPVRDHYQNVCITNPDSARFPDRQGTCQCLGNAMGKHFALRGEEAFRQILSTNPNAMDPMAAALADPSIQTLAQEKLIACLK